MQKIIKSRTFEIKVDIFQNYKGFKPLESFKVKGVKKNFFSKNFYDQKNKVSFYKNLKYSTL